MAAPHKHSRLKKNIVVSAVLALMFSLICLMTNNMSVFTGESMLQLHIFQTICEKSGIDNHKNNYDDFLFVDVAHSKMLVPFTIAGSDTISMEAITDRKLLLDLLIQLEKADDYKYVIIDIELDKRNTAFDDSLYLQIAKMERVAIAAFDGIGSAYPGLADKSGKTNYYHTIFEPGFRRYQYIQEGSSESLPLHVFNKLYPQRSISPIGHTPLISLYFSNNRLCQNSVYLMFEENEDLSRQQIGYLTRSFTDGETADQIVIIGDMKSDIHATYMQEKQGPLILANALLSLENDRHIVSFLQMLMWYTTFFISIFFILSDTQRKIKDFTRRKTNGILGFALCFISYSALFLITSFVDYAVFGRIYSVIVPLICLSAFQLQQQFKQFKSHENN